MIFSQDDINSSDTEEEEESDNNYNSEEKEVDDNVINDEEEEGEGNNDDNEVEEERNNDEEERNGEEEEIHQIIEALDKDEIHPVMQCLEEEFSILPKVFVKDKYSIEEQAQDNDDTKVVSPPPTQRPFAKKTYKTKKLLLNKCHQHEDPGGIGYVLSLQ
ncbi:hypothetical protein RCL_jg7585.t1 [Rhizophagus clarus]|uniref:Uncharacterized protein n=1 Tax=Rhizophagus clarus TaxID=94130 RepID=A0A8H3MF78_9GLOM|nr:hypothetical protein RCL_jg7585.t1 [Rhizophagus clarus]